MGAKKKIRKFSDSSRRQIVIDVLAQTILEILKKQSSEGRDGKH